MKLQFNIQQFQSDAVKSITDIFDGASIKNSEFTIDISQDKGENDQLNIGNQEVNYAIGLANKLNLTDDDLFENVRKVQEYNNIKMSDDLHHRNFSIEMETGTGKTYVYTKTILELNKLYGFRKFIIVVPSIAIKEGVLKSLEITESHFKEHYDNAIYNYFLYDSSDLKKVQTFATSTNVEIMIINIDAFRKSFDDPDKDNKANIIHRAHDKLSGNRPIDLIASTNPIVIIDEPQSVDNTKNAKKALKTLNALFTLRYSATHKEPYNIMYRLTPVDAYHQNLVKKIEVASVINSNAHTQDYIKLVSVNGNNGYSARIEINYRKSNGDIEQKAVSVSKRDDIHEKANELDYYKDKGYFVTDISTEVDNEYIEFLNGIKIKLGEAINESSPHLLKRAQIRETIDRHLQKELYYINQGIKVISLFFLDEVNNYRVYNDDGTTSLGQYAKWFEEEFQYLTENKYKHLVKTFPEMNYYPSEVHDGYFAKDNKGKLKNSKNGDSNDDESAYQLIMQNKERLLSLEEPIRFIFSHSALKEGWDNPNVFQVCTLIESKDTITKRQKVGRGLRLCVDQTGKRVEDMKYNSLCVIANESYFDFASSLQKEFEAEGYEFGVVKDISFTGLAYSSETLNELNQNDSIKIYKYLIEEGYVAIVNRNNKDIAKATEKFYSSIDNGSFKVPVEYHEFTDKIANQIESLSREVEIHDANEKIQVKRNKEVYLSETFSDLWNRIKQKTLYKVNLNSDEIIRAAIYDINHMPEIKANIILKAHAKLTVAAKGVTVKEDSFAKAMDIHDFETMHVPDLVRRLQDNTGLLRKTLVSILKETKRQDDFFINPEQYIKQVSQVINSVKQAKIKDGLEYYKLDDYYVQEEIFDDNEIFGYKNKNIIDISDRKNVFDHVIFDSIIERQFAEDAERDEDVLLYAKLPSKFLIDTPFGKYNPDWVVVMRKDNEDKLYFVAETKGNVDKNSLRQSEKDKIDCGIKHFEVVDNEIKYDVVNSLQLLKLRSGI